MSSMWKSDIVAILCADLHLSHKPPVARSAEPNWFEAMKRQLEELTDLSKDMNAPIICAGDIFHKWNSPPELINFAIENLPTMYAIPGNHDLPLHNYYDRHKSAYWTLVKAKIIIDISTTIRIEGANHNKYPDLVLHPFPSGFEVTPIQKGNDSEINLAVVHDYIWVNDKKYSGAPEDKRVGRRMKSFVGYDAMVWGDNHKGFICNKIVNCGSFFRRNIDEISYEPMIGLLIKDGSIRRYKLDCSKDKFIDIGEITTLAEKGIETADFIKELVGLGKHLIDFVAAVKEYCKRNNIDKTVESLIQEVMEQ